MTAVPETTPPDLLAQLAAMRTRALEERSYLNLAPGDEASPADDVLRLLAIPEALLNLADDWDDRMRVIYGPDISLSETSSMAREVRALIAAALAPAAEDGSGQEVPGGH